MNYYVYQPTAEYRPDTEITNRQQQGISLFLILFWLPEAQPLGVLERLHGEGESAYLWTHFWTTLQLIFLLRFLPPGPLDDLLSEKIKKVLSSKPV